MKHHGLSSGLGAQGLDGRLELADFRLRLMNFGLFQFSLSDSGCASDIQLCAAHFGCLIGSKSESRSFAGRFRSYDSYYSSYYDYP